MARRAYKLALKIGAALLLLGIAPAAQAAQSGARGGPSNSASPSAGIPKQVNRYPPLERDVPPSLEELNKLRVYDFDPKQGLSVDDFTVWTVDDLGRPDPKQQAYLRLVARDLERGDYHLVVMLKDAPAITDLLFYIRYHQDKWHPLSVRPGSAFGMEGDRLWFGNLEVPGVLCCGMTRVRPDVNEGIKLADGVVCEAVFVERPFDYKPRWLGHAPDYIGNIPRNVQAYSDPPTRIDPRGCDVVLYWEETNRGDYNNDGEVSMTDLLPLGRRYGMFSTDGREDDWDRLADGNEDAEVNYRDIFLIQDNYGALLSGYRVYRRLASERREREVLLPHPTLPLLPLSIHRPKVWEPNHPVAYRFFDREIGRGSAPVDYVYRIVPYDGSDDVEGKDSDLEVTVRVSASEVAVVGTRAHTPLARDSRVR
jgi:hypothetical protein